MPFDSWTRRRYLVAAGLSTALAGCLGDDPDPESDSDGEQDDDDATADPDLEDDSIEQADDSPSHPDDLGATLHTSMGNISVVLFGERVPNTVENFVGLATGDRAWVDPETGDATDEPLYEDVLFHRIIEGFMIQTGDPEGTGRGGPGYQFDDEFHDDLSHHSPGVLSMANSGPDTNGSQFFITLEATPHLDGRHSVFGEVVDGMDVVESIGSVETDDGDRPLEDVVLESVTVSTSE